MTAVGDTRIAMDGTWVDPMLPAYSDRCRCPACREYFASTAAFDRHRTGDFRSDRRCRSGAEMVELGMARARTGHWMTRPRPLQRWPWNQFPVAPEPRSAPAGTYAAPSACEAPA
jgi:hypothetical protein